MLEDEAQRLKGQRQARLVPHVALHGHIMLINASGCLHYIINSTKEEAVDTVALASSLLTGWLTAAYAVVAQGHRGMSRCPQG